MQKALTASAKALRWACIWNVPGVSSSWCVWSGVSDEEHGGKWGWGEVGRSRPRRVWWTLAGGDVMVGNVTPPGAGRDPM